MLAKEGRRPLLVAADVYRPAAIKQLQVLGEKVKVPVFSLGEQDPVAISRAALEKARREAYDTVLIAVSYTHLDVYKRQGTSSLVSVDLTQAAG